MAVFSVDRIILETEEIVGSKEFRLRMLVRRLDTREWASVLRHSFDGAALMRPGDRLLIKLRDMEKDRKLTFEPRPDLDAEWES